MYVRFYDGRTSSMLNVRTHSNLHNSGLRTTFYEKTPSARPDSTLPSTRFLKAHITP